MIIKKNIDTPKTEVEEKARGVRAQLGFGTKSVREALGDFVSSIGGTIEYCSDFDNREETLTVRDRNDFTIYLSAGATVARDNFTIAHELGHFYLHVESLQKHSSGYIGHFTRRGSNRQEWEANWFAAELLMPTAEFKRAAITFSNNPDILAQKFGVSSAAASVRLKALNIV